ncbi:inositol monophosphatase [Pyronema omphalodes]|nr:inositol monophosphatase [Pyronema omphalodes]
MATITPNEYQTIHDLLVKVALAAGDMITTAKPQNITAKNNSADLVTATDKAVEDYVMTQLKSQYPDFEFLGEETYKPGMQLTSAPTFICDPVDGTTNFIHGFPYMCISLALTVDKLPVVGVVYNPYTTNLYTAIKGQGSFVETRVGHFAGQKMQLPRGGALPLKALNGSLCAVEWGSDRSGVNFDIKSALYTKLAASTEQGGKMVHSLRSLGSAALNLCGVASGEMDLYWEGGCWAWDVAAGWLILEEAGGKMYSGNAGEEVAVDCRRYLAIRAAGEGSQVSQEELRDEFWGCLTGAMNYSS